MFLPLHAAGIYNAEKEDCCSDYVVSSYTPTLTALLRAHKSDTSFSKIDAKLGVVAAMKAQGLPMLWNIKKEIDYVRAAAQVAGISVNDRCVENEAIVAHVAESLKSTHIMHIACHGTQNAEDPLSSGFCLVDGSLTVSRLMELNLEDAVFAFLSACETAKGDMDQPDQTVHLAAAMLFVGFRSVVGTMW
jgi:CHAT domain-containing protein